MISPILWLATKTRLSQTVIKWAGGALLIVAAVVAFNLWQADVKRDAVVADRAAAKAKADKAKDAATKAADAKAALRDEKSRELAKELNERIEYAKTAHPIDAAKPVGPVTNATLDELRKRKASLR